MRKRGRILREPGSAPGLLMVEGRQFRFTHDTRWKSEIAPKPGLVVEVDLDHDAQILAIAAIPPSQLAQEQAESRRSNAASKARASQLRTALVATAPDLVAAALLLVAWCALTTVSIRSPLLGEIDFSFWQILGLLNTKSALEAIDPRSVTYGTGLYGIAACLALAAPFAYRLHRGKWTALCGLAPLLFLLIIWNIAGASLQNLFGENLAGPYREIARQAQVEIVKHGSLAMGAYLSALASLYFAMAGMKRFFASYSAGTTVAERARQAAA